MRCNQNLSDDREVIPCTDGIEYPSLPEVCCSSCSFLLYLTSFFLWITRWVGLVMQHDNHCGESWDDLHLNDMICAQTQAWANKQKSTNLLEWMREMCHRGSEPEVKMVMGEQAFQFGRLVALEMWREVMKERRRLDWLMDKLVESKEMKVGMRELMEMNLDLVCWVLRLEEAQEKRRVHWEERWWSPSPVRPKRKQALQFAGGDGSEGKLYVELGLLLKGVLVEEPVASGSGVVSGEHTPAMVMAPLTPLPASLDELD